jgi:N-acetylated-alpha-linked acidic dipeptidase
VSLLETARGVAAAVAEGFQPRRSIVFGSWGGEDFFLLGSTEWGEQFADELKENMVVYINRESYTSGDWSAAGNHSLERFMIETSKDAPHPEAATLFDAWQGQQPGEALGLGALGSGSDYTVFLDHLGVPSLNVGYGSPNGIYHSLYDTYYYYQRFGDPGYKYGVAQADMVGRMVMRLANADILPFDFTSASGVIAGYVDELVAMDEGGLLRDELREIGAANAAMRVAATETNGVLARLLGAAAASAEQNRSAVDQVNALIMRAEREMIDERGLWRRPWYRNLIYAPGYYEGYAAKTLPGVREPMEDGAWEVARTQAGMLVEALERVTLALTEAGTVARAATTRVIS